MGKYLQIARSGEDGESASRPAETEQQRGECLKADATRTLRPYRDRVLPLRKASRPQNQAPVPEEGKRPRPARWQSSEEGLAATAPIHSVAHVFVHILAKGQSRSRTCASKAWRPDVSEGSEGGNCRVLVRVRAGTTREVGADSGRRSLAQAVFIWGRTLFG
jgi:hypothetical protein